MPPLHLAGKWWVEDGVLHAFSYLRNEMRTLPMRDIRRVEVTPRTFTPPGDDDWVLVLDDSAREYQPVGHAADRSMTF